MKAFNIKSLSILVAICSTFVTPVFAGAENDEKYEWSNGGTEDVENKSEQDPQPICEEGVPCADPTVIVKQIGWGEWLQDHKWEVGIAGSVVAILLGGALGVLDTHAVIEAATQANGFRRYVQLGADNKAIVDATAQGIMNSKRLYAAGGALITWVSSFSFFQYYLGTQKPAEKDSH